MSEQKVSQRIILQSTDPVQFVSKIQELILAGAVVDENEYPRIKQFPFTLHFLKYGSVKNKDWMIKEDAQIKVFELPVESFEYDAQDLAEMSWEDLKRVFKAKGIGARDRTQGVRKYLEVTGQQVWAEASPDEVVKPKKPQHEPKGVPKEIVSEETTPAKEATSVKAKPKSGKGKSVEA